MPTLGAPHSESPQHSGGCFISRVIFVSLFTSTGGSSLYTDSVRATALTAAREARLDIVLLDNAVEQYFSQGLPTATRKVYATGIWRFIELCNQLHITPLPAHELLLCKFLSYLALNGIHHNSIKVYLAAVRQLHIQEGQDRAGDQEVHKLKVWRVESG